MEMVVKRIDRVLGRNNLGAKLMIKTLEDIQAEMNKAKNDLDITEYSLEVSKLEALIEGMDDTILEFISIATKEIENSSYGDMSRKFVIQSLEQLKANLIEL